MKHVIRSGLVAAVILVMIASTFAISPMNVSASSTTYIMPDGSVEPASAPIIRHGNKYKLADNVYGPIYIQKSGVTLNGDGYTVQGTPTEYGVYLNSVSHVTLKNLIVRGFYQNIKLWEADHNTILKCKVTEAAYEGIVLTASSNNVVKENEAYANGDDGISLFTTGGVGSADNVITRNKLYENRWNGMVVYGSEHRRNLITENTVYGQNVGIFVLGAESSTFEKNLVYWNKLDGMYIRGSYYALVSGNTFRENGARGLMIRAGQYSTYEQNMILNNNIGLGFRRGATGQNVVQNNWIQGNEIGMEIFDKARNNYMIRNTITMNDIGITLDGTTSNNRLHHNNFIGNTVQAVEQGANIWDDGMYEGNHWSDYTGVDLNRDGVGDTDLPHQGLDGYPLIGECKQRKVHIIRFKNI